MLQPSLLTQKIKKAEPKENGADSSQANRATSKYNPKSDDKDSERAVEQHNIMLVDVMPAKGRHFDKPTPQVANDKI